jgi:heat shock protein HslJ
LAYLAHFLFLPEAEGGSLYLHISGCKTGPVGGTGNFFCPNPEKKTRCLLTPSLLPVEKSLGRERGTGMTLCRVARALRLAVGVGLVVAMGFWTLPAAAAAEGFPFDQELLLDTKAMKGSKRVPMLDIKPDGAVLIDLWCNSVQGQLVVAAHTVTVLTGPKTERSCAPERMRGDEEILSLLEQVTTWRREGDTVVLIGPRKLRFYRATN